MREIEGTEKNQPELEAVFTKEGYICRIQSYRRRIRRLLHR